MSDLHRPRVLLVEDDRATLTFLADNLTVDGFECVACDSVIAALRKLEVAPADLAIVDMNLADGDSGLDLMRHVRMADGVRIDPRTPLLVLSGRAAELDRLRAFAVGCDDYVVKPFSYQELKLRIDAILRRAAAVDRPLRSRRVRVGALEVDPHSRVATVDGVALVLSQKEFALLRALASSPERVWTKDELLRDIWGFRTRGSTRTLDSHACRLRSKLAAAGATGMVVNVWGVGYRLIDQALVAA